jgi:Sec-independent protein translocase protein TatA
MAGIRRRFHRSLVTALLVPFSALPLLAQHGGGSGGAGLLPLLLLLVVVFILFTVLRNISRWLKQRADRARRQREELQRRRQEELQQRHRDEPQRRQQVEPRRGQNRVADPKLAQSKSVFISYRRKDSPHFTGRLYDKLSDQLGEGAVFRDVNNIPLGVNFREHIRKQLEYCAVLVAVIGRNWDEIDGSGNRRLNDPKDPLRIEIETALEKSIDVIPVLVDGAEMPTAEELPSSLAGLPDCNAITVRPDPDFRNDMDCLLRGIIKSLLR